MGQTNETSEASKTSKMSEISKKTGKETGAMTGSDYETRIGQVTGVVHSGQGDVFHIEKIELAATRTADALRQALSGHVETRDQLLDLLQRLASLQAQLSEWKELHHILHEILVAFAPFDASLRVMGQTSANPGNGRALLQTWRPCQRHVDYLIDFESRAEYIRPASPTSDVALVDWGSRIALLRHEVEDRLREAHWSLEGLLDLTDEFGYVCDCYLSLADRELRRIVEKVQRLYTHLLGGLQ